MPIYEYQCLSCGKRTEELQRMSDPPLAACPSCGGEVKKLVSSPAFHLKGSGWYATDYGAKKGGGESGSEGKSESSKGEGSSEKGAGGSEKSEKSEKSERSEKKEGSSSSSESSSSSGGKKESSSSESSASSKPAASKTD